MIVRRGDRLIVSVGESCTELQDAAIPLSEFPWAYFTAHVCVQVAEHGDKRDIAQARVRLRAAMGGASRRVDRAWMALFEALASRREANREVAKRYAAEAEALFGELLMPLERAKALEVLGRMADALEIYRCVSGLRNTHRREELLTSVNRLGRPATALTNREREVATLVAQGKSNAAIAKELVLSRRTVEHHVAAIFDKFGVSTRAEVAVHVAREQAALT